MIRRDFFYAENSDGIRLRDSEKDSSCILSRANQIWKQAVSCTSRLDTKTFNPLSPNTYSFRPTICSSPPQTLCLLFWFYAVLELPKWRWMLKLMAIELMKSSNHLTLCHPLLLLPSIFPSIRVFSNESALHIRWPKYCSFSIIGHHLQVFSPIQ